PVSKPRGSPSWQGSGAHFSCDAGMPDSWETELPEEVLGFAHPPDMAMKAQHKAASILFHFIPVISHTSCPLKRRSLSVFLPFRHQGIFQMPDDLVQHLLQKPVRSLLRYPVAGAAQRNRQFGSKRFFLRRYGKGDVCSVL